MDTMMLVVTVASVVVAAVSAAIAWQVTRAERQRRAARVAALAAAAGLGPRGADGAALVMPAPAPATVPAGLHEFMPARDEAPWASTTASGVPADEPVAVSHLFAPPVAASASSGRQQWLLGAAGVFAAVVVTFAGIGFLGSRAVSSASAPLSTPLELVALTHNRADGSLAVSGLVRNPPAGGRVQALEAKVRVFDAAGILIGTRSAPVDAATLAPGQEASFAVALGDLVTAARYRVSFHAAGTMLPHVDRRTNLPAAVTADAR